MLLSWFITYIMMNGSFTSTTKEITPRWYASKLKDFLAHYPIQFSITGHVFSLIDGFFKIEDKLCFLSLKSGQGYPYLTRIRIFVWWATLIPLHELAFVHPLLSHKHSLLSQSLSHTPIGHYSVTQPGYVS